MAKEMDTLQNLSLVSELKQIIVAAKQQAQITVNSQLTLLYWQIGEKIQNHTLNNARADYGKQVIKQLASELTQEFGKGFKKKSLRRMLQFYQSYPAQNIVATLSRQLSWSHFVELLTIKQDIARDFYAQMAMNDRWSVRELERQFDATLFERAVLNPPKVSPVVTQTHSRHSRVPQINNHPRVLQINSHSRALQKSRHPRAPQLNRHPRALLSGIHLPSRHHLKPFSGITVPRIAP